MMNRTKPSDRSTKPRATRALMERLENRRLLTAAAETPFLGTPFTTNQTIPFVEYDKGGSGVAYHDTTAGNQGNSSLRAGDSVDIETGGSGGNVVGFTAAGESLNYTVKVPAAGNYSLQASVANVESGGSFHASVGGKNVTGTIGVLASAGWQTYKTVASASFALSAGTQVVQIYLDRAAANGAVGNLDWLKLVPAVGSTPPTITPPSSGEAPFLGTPFTTGENIPLADYDLGGSGVAFHDTSMKNPGNADDRDPDPVGVEAGGNNSGNVVGFTAAGEWLQFTVKVATAGNYKLSVLAANPGTGALIHGSVNGSDLTGSMTILNTGSWNNYETVVSSPFKLAAGTQIFRVSFDHASSNGALGNFDVFQLVPTTGATSGETPYLTAFATNQTIPAAQYDKGGSGVAYHDTTSTNLGGDGYRGSDAVDIQSGGATDNLVIATAGGEWLNYTINVATAGTYVLDASVSSPVSGGKFHAAIGSTTIGGTISIPATGGFGTFTTVASSSFWLSAGAQVLHISMDTASSNGSVGDFDWFQVNPAPASTTVTIKPLVWNTVHNATEGLAEAKSVGVNGLLYVFGGYYTTTPEYRATTSSEVYNPATDKWAKLAPLPAPTTHMGIATDGKYIYIVGGYTYDPKTTYQTFGTTNSWRYDIAHNSWSKFVPLPQARGAGDMEYLNGYLHFFDGLAPPKKTPENTHWMLNLNTPNPQWVLSTPTPFSRNHFSAAVLNGKIYLMGGRSIGDDLSNPSFNCIVWDPEHPGAWKAIASLPQIRALGVSAVIDGRIFLAGGTTSSYKPIDTVIMYDPATNKWTTQTPMPAQRLAPCGGAVGNDLIVTTGLGQTLQATTWVAKISVG